MSPNKTLYIREDDVPIWERAEQAAKTTSQSVSQLVTSALQHYLPSVQAPAGAMEPITVELGNGDRTWTEGFTGRWLFEQEGSDFRRGIAQTKRGKFAAYSFVERNSTGYLTVHDSLDDIDFEPEILAQAAAELGQERVVWRDL